MPRVIHPCELPSAWKSSFGSAIRRSPGRAQKPKVREKDAPHPQMAERGRKTAPCENDPVLIGRRLRGRATQARSREPEPAPDFFLHERKSCGWAGIQ